MAICVKLSEGACILGFLVAATGVGLLIAHGVTHKVFYLEAGNGFLGGGLGLLAIGVVVNKIIDCIRCCRGEVL